MCDAHAKTLAAKLASVRPMSSSVGNVSFYEPRSSEVRGVVLSDIASVATGDEVDEVVQGLADLDAVHEAQCEQEAEDDDHSQ